jgi:Flp pilus assembly protein TadB
VVVWRLIAWMVFAVAQRRAELAGDADRERASANLREHYAGGHLTLDDFSRRTGRVLSARSHVQVQRALFGLSRPSAVDTARSAVRDLVLVVVSGAYVLFSLVLAFVLGLTVLLHGVSAPAFLAIALIWLVPTYLFARLRRAHLTL